MSARLVKPVQLPETPRGVSGDLPGNPDFSPYDEKIGNDDGSRYSPTVDVYGALLAAFSFYNEELFGGILPPCLITLQRRRGAYGYFCGNRFAETGNAAALTSEIAINPALMAGRTDEENFGTFVHEMTHHWQFYFSSYPSRRLDARAYHDREWAAKMEEIGLIPSDTGQPGGARTGMRVSHYIQDGGAFQQATAELLATGLTLKWADADQSKRQDGNRDTGKKRDQSKRKFTCTKCRQNAWANHNSRLLCGGETCAGARMVLED